MNTLLVVLLIALSVWLLYLGRGKLAWLLPLAVGLLLWRVLGEGGTFGWWLCTVLFLALAGTLAWAPVRRALLSRRLMPMLAPLFPTMSATEREALEAGTVWWDAELFAGRPDWSKLLNQPVPELDAREQAFLDGPCEELCRMLDDWQVLHSDDLPTEVWDFLKREGFLGLIIPESYGGKGFSARANSAVVAKVSSRSVTAAVTVMVPNSLGPAELLLHYGTEAQKQHYLPRLASGAEVPCFALTEPGAGSDAGSMTSHGVVCRGTWEGREVLGMRLNWNKRYITLNKAATVLGLAFKLRDPDGLLGDKEELGITCALIPRETPGVVADKRHDPLGVPFINGPTQGHDVFVPLEFIIGGPANAGKGWRMLMDCLAAGRGVSLPAQSCGAAQLTARTTGAYASIREQFGLPIGRFEGVEEHLAIIGGMTYLMDGARRLTAASIDSGQKPAVITAICKAYLTEGMRTVVNNGMDVVGGAGISRGPRNVLARAYQALPVAITVEGANTLTRSMIIFGQGAVRCHPYALEEIESLAARDVKRFDAAFFGHIAHFFGVFTRASVLGWTHAVIAPTPLEGPAERYFQHFTRLSAAYAVCAEISMMTLGGALKRKEMLTGRLADGLAWLYLGTATLKRFVDAGQPDRDRALFEWAAETALHEVETALLGLLDNLPARFVARVLRWKLFPPLWRFHGPSDRQRAKAARALLDGDPAREALTTGIFVPPATEPGLGALEDALTKVLAAQPVRAKLKDLVREGKLERAREAAQVEAALAAGHLSEAEADCWRAAAAAREDVIQVDAF
ncbi:MAG: acyl-CoA dehydrogenase [Planctomycetes bacterium]|nr:acyl-CoA dehydrogenase [Planctomycetota bacterium]